MGLFNSLFGKKPTNQEQDVPKQTQKGNGETHPKSQSDPQPKAVTQISEQKTTPIPVAKKPVPEQNVSGQTTPWRTFSIFISSTFADMQAERDHLKNVVFPKVEEELQKRRIKLEIVDLRWGVDTTSMAQEDEREANVLKVCLDEIRRCRPFFIGLLGDRYGWVPPLERMKTALVAEKHIVPEKGKSVTDLEIEFGVLASREQLVRSVFYFREPLPYDTFSKKKAGMFSDEYNNELSEAEKKERKAALLILKAKIVAHFIASKQENKVKTYSGQWDAANEKLTGLKPWGDQVYTDILTECESHAKDTWDKVPKNWQEQEMALLDAFIEQHTHITTNVTDGKSEKVPTFCGREELLKELKKHLLSDDSSNWGKVLTGESGSGKSAVFSMMNKIMKQEECIILAHSAGLSPRAKSVADLLKIWNRQLVILGGLKEEVMDETITDDERSFHLPGQPDIPITTPIEKLQEKFVELLQIVSAQKRVLLLIDALDRFDPTPRAQHLSWLPTVIPQNLRVLCTAITGTEQKATQFHKGLTEKSIDKFSKPEAEEMLNALCKRNHKTLAEKARKIILEKKRNDGELAISIPLWLSLAANMLMALDQDDFEKISKLEGSGGEQIETYLARISNEFDPSPGPLFISLVQKAGAVFGDTFTKPVFDYLAISRNGLRERDLEKLMSEKTWDSLQFANLRRWFKAHLVLQGEELHWNLAHSILRNTLSEKFSKTEYSKMHESISKHLLSLPETDSLRISETMFHLLESENLTDAAMYYAGIESSEEIDGATKVLAEVFITNEKGMNKILQLPELLISNTDSFQELLKKYIKELDDAVALEGNLSKRSIMLPKLIEILPISYDYDNVSVEFGYSLNNLFLKTGYIFSQSGDIEKALKYFEICEKIGKEIFEKDTFNPILRHNYTASLLQVGTTLDKLGRQHEAIEYFNNIITILREIPDTYPDYNTVKKSLSTTYLQLGNIHQDICQMKPALNFFETAIELMQELHKDSPLNQAINYELGNCYNHLGSLNRSIGNVEIALKCYESSFEIANKLYKSEPNNEKLKAGIAHSYALLGEIHQEKGQLEKAIECYEFYKRYSEELYNINNQNELLKEYLATAYGKLGEIYDLMELREDALKNYEEAYELIKDIHLKNPLKDFVKINFSIVNTKLGEIYQKTGKTEKAIKCFELSYRLTKELYHTNSSNVNIKMSFALSNSKLGSFYKELNRWEESLNYFESAFELMKELYDANSSNESIKKNLSYSLRDIGEIFQIQGKQEKALKNYSAAHELIEQLCFNNPDSGENKEMLSSIYEKLGLVHQEMSHIDDAIKYFDRDVKLLKELLLTHKQRELILNKLALSLWKMGEMYGLKGILNDALFSYDTCLGYVLELTKINPGSESNMNYLANGYGKIGEIMQALEKQDDAFEYFEKSLKIFQELVNINPSNEGYKEGLVTTYGQLAELHQNKGNLIESLKNYLTANELLSELNKTFPDNVNIFARWGISFYKISMVYKAMEDNKNGRQYFLLWKEIIELLVVTYPDISDYQQWNNLDYGTQILQKEHSNVEKETSPQKEQKPNSAIREMTTSQLIQCGEFQKALQMLFADEVRIRSKPNNNVEFQANIGEQAFILTKLGRYKDSLEKYKIQAKVCTRNKLNKEYVDCLLSQAELLIEHLNKPKQAKSLLEEAILIAQENNWNNLIKEAQQMLNKIT